ncbi:hypothetical protein Hanom_Chr03g00188161 [Helianthus anomalus]
MIHKIVKIRKVMAGVQDKNSSHFPALGGPSSPGLIAGISTSQWSASTRLEVKSFLRAGSIDRNPNQSSQILN